MNLGFSDPQPPIAGQGKFEGISRGMKAIKYPPDSAATHAADRLSVRSLSSGPWILSSPSLLSPAMISLPSALQNAAPPLLHPSPAPQCSSFRKSFLREAGPHLAVYFRYSSSAAKYVPFTALIPRAPDAHSLISCPYSARKSLTEGRSHTLFHFVSLV